MPLVWLSAFKITIFEIYQKLSKKSWCLIAGKCAWKQTVIKIYLSALFVCEMENLNWQNLIKIVDYILDFIRLKYTFGYLCNIISNGHYANVPRVSMFPKRVMFYWVPYLPEHFSFQFGPLIWECNSF